jgi:hypothetical protein
MILITGLALLVPSGVTAGCGYHDYTHPYVRTQREYRERSQEQMREHDRFVDEQHDLMAPTRIYRWEESKEDKEMDEGMKEMETDDTWKYTGPE